MVSNVVSSSIVSILLAYEVVTTWVLISIWKLRVAISNVRWLILESIASASSVLLRQKILRKCREDIYHFLDRENGQIAIYDAVNPLATGRRSLAKEFAKHDIQVIATRCYRLEGHCLDYLESSQRIDSIHRIILHWPAYHRGERSQCKNFFSRCECSFIRLGMVTSIRGKANNKKYVGWAAEDAIKHYLQRISAKIPHFETMEEKELNFIKVSTWFFSVKIRG